MAIYYIVKLFVVSLYMPKYKTFFYAFDGKNTNFINNKNIKLNCFT